MLLTLLRDETSETTTIGKLFVDGVWKWFSLEDRLHDGPKIPGDTCIPAGKYRVVITHSNRFKRDLPLLLNVPQFQGIRIHPGNTFLNTEGCILAGGGYEPRTMTITHSRRACDMLQADIQAVLDRQEEVWIDIINPLKVPAAKPMSTSVVQV